MMSFNALIYILYLVFFILLFLPIDTFFVRVVGAKKFSTTLPPLLLIVFFLLVMIKSGIIGVIYAALTFAGLWAFFYGFLSQRKHIYILAIILFVSCILFHVLGINKIAEFFATLVYLCLALGAFKDVFYDRIVDE